MVRALRSLPASPGRPNHDRTGCAPQALRTVVKEWCAIVPPVSDDAVAAGGSDRPDALEIAKIWDRYVEAYRTGAMSVEEAAAFERDMAAEGDDDIIGDLRIEREAALNGARGVILELLKGRNQVS